MSVEINKATDTRLSVAQEIKLEKPLLDFHPGEILKATVTSANHEEIMLNINGHQFRGKNLAQFNAGDVLEVKVLDNQDELAFDILQSTSSKSILQAALLEALPKQAPATVLFELLNQINHLTKIPEGAYQHIKTLLNSITTLAELPQEIIRAIAQSGLFLEFALGRKKDRIENDFKAQCLKLLASLSVNLKNVSPPPLPTLSKSIGQDPLPLPGAIPQPIQKDFSIDFNELSIEEAHTLLRDQVSQVLSRINVNQINHLMHDNKEGYLIMLDLPVRTPQGVEVIPLMIEQRKVLPMHPAPWSISFALNLTHLGNIQGKLMMSGREIELKFNVENPVTLTTLENYKSEVNHALSGIGLQLKEWKLQLGLEKNHIDVENLHLLDIRI